MGQEQEEGLWQDEFIVSFTNSNTLPAVSTSAKEYRKILRLILFSVLTSTCKTVFLSTMK